MAKWFRKRIFGTIVIVAFIIPVVLFMFGINVINTGTGILLFLLLLAWWLRPIIAKWRGKMKASATAREIK